MKNLNTISELRDEIKGNNELLESFKENPVATLNKITKKPLDNDHWIYRIVVLSLGLSILFIVITVFILLLNYKTFEVPTLFTAISSAAIGAIAGILAPSPARS